jgi:dienelactone hydrolase
VRLLFVTALQLLVAHPVIVRGEEIRREDILRRMSLVMGSFPGKEVRVPLDVRTESEQRCDKYTRIKLSFAVEKDDRVPAWLLVPHGQGKRPAVLCLHQTIPAGKDEPVGLAGSPDLAYAHELAERGYVTLAPDYPSFGEYRYDFGKRHWGSGSLKAVWNNQRALDVLSQRPEVNADRIGAIGHSLGGHNAMFTAAFDERIRATVSNCGFTSFAKYYGGNLKGWTSDRYMPKIATEYQCDPRRMPFDFTDVILAMLPRAFLACAPLRDSNFEVSGVRDVMAAVKPHFERLGLANRLQAIYPDCAHEFPKEVRAVAYAFLDKQLKH